MKVLIAAFSFLALAYAMPADFTTYNGRQGQQYPQAPNLVDDGYGTTQGYNSHYNNQRPLYFNSYPVSGNSQPNHNANGQYGSPYQNGQNGAPYQNTYGHQNQNPYAGVLPVGYGTHH
uniref:Secreted protein n=1 Tax=Steinernema glaseri TaxID=37863 RepID=A0A1I7Y9D9_9BILA